jgi:transposase-like protein
VDSRRAIVSEVRAGASVRSVARRHGVSRHTVQRWVDRAGDQPLDAVNWNDQPAGPHCPHNRTARKMEERVLQERMRLRQESDLGERSDPNFRLLLQEVNFAPHRPTFPFQD